MILNHEVILSKIDDLNKLDCYIPLLLHRYIDLNYFDRINDTVAQEYYRNRTQLQREGNPSKFLEEDLLTWLKKHKEFEDIIEW